MFAMFIVYVLYAMLHDVRILDLVVTETGFIIKSDSKFQQRQRGVAWNDFVGGLFEANM